MLNKCFNFKIADIFLFASRSWRDLLRDDGESFFWEQYIGVKFSIFI